MCIQMFMCLFKASMTDWLTADYWANECWKRAKFNGRSVLLLPLPFSSLFSPLLLPPPPPPALPCCSRKSNQGDRISVCMCVCLCVFRLTLIWHIKLAEEWKQKVHNLWTDLWWRLFNTLTCLKGTVQHFGEQAYSLLRVRWELFLYVDLQRLVRLRWSHLLWSLFYCFFFISVVSELYRKMTFIHILHSCNVSRTGKPLLIWFGIYACFHDGYPWFSSAFTSLN